MVNLFTYQEQTRCASRPHSHNAKKYDEPFCRILPFSSRESQTLLLLSSPNGLLAARAKKKIHGPVRRARRRLVEPEQPTNLIHHPIRRKEECSVVVTTAGVGRFSVSPPIFFFSFLTLVADRSHCYEASVYRLQPNGLVSTHELWQLLPFPQAGGKTIRVILV